MRMHRFNHRKMENGSYLVNFIKLVSSDVCNMCSSFMNLPRPSTERQSCAIEKNIHFLDNRNSDISLVNSVCTRPHVYVMFNAINNENESKTLLFCCKDRIKCIAA